MARLGDICDVRDGTHDSPSYVDAGYPLVTSKNIVDGKLDLSVVNYISLDDYNKINERSKVDDGDIIMPMIGTIGNPYLVSGFTDFAIKNVALIKFNDEKVNNKYIYCFLNSDKFKGYVAENNRGGTQKFLSLKDIRNMEINIVSLDEQLEIVEILDKISGLIKCRQVQLLKLDELVKSRFVELFGDPKSNPFNWSTERLASTMDVRGRVGWKGYKKEDLRDNGPLVLGATHLSDDGKIDLSEPVYLSMEKYEESPEIMVKKNDLIFAQRGSLGKVGLVEEDYEMATINPCVLILRPTNINPQFARYLLMVQKDTGELDKLNSGSTIPMITQKAIGDFDIIVPPMELQNQFAAFVEQTDKSKLAIQKSLEKLETLKKALMQKYFG